MKVIMRKAKRSDIDAMNRIFNAGMGTDGAVLDIDPKDEAYRLAWFAEHDKRHPVFVGELDGTVICWAALSRYSHDYPYDGVAVLSIYLDPGITITGLWDSLLRFVENQASELGYYKLVVSLFATNRNALHSYRSAGFRDVGIYRSHGFYKGELVDMVYMERLLTYDIERLKQYYREHYPFYESFFAREEALQELQMLRNGMMRSPDDPTRWIPTPKEGVADADDWGGATVRKVRGLPTLEELLELQLSERGQSAEDNQTPTGNK